jgi:hypothetical protein
MKEDPTLHALVVFVKTGILFVHLWSYTVCTIYHKENLQFLVRYSFACRLTGLQQQISRAIEGNREL